MVFVCGCGLCVCVCVCVVCVCVMCVCVCVCVWCLIVRDLETSTVRSIWPVRHTQKKRDFPVTFPSANTILRITLIYSNPVITTSVHTIPRPQCQIFCDAI